MCITTLSSLDQMIARWRDSGMFMKLEDSLCGAVAEVLSAAKAEVVALCVELFGGQCDRLAGPG